MCAGLRPQEAHTAAAPKTQTLITPHGAVARRKPEAGDMQWDGAVWRRWSGARWVTARYSLSPQRLLQPQPLSSDPQIEGVGRQRALDLAVEDQVAANGAAVVHSGPSGVVLSYRPRISHGLHAVATLLTAGLWGIAWLYVVFSARDDRVRLEPDQWGNVWAVCVASSR